MAALASGAPYRAALTDPEVGLPNDQFVRDRFHVEKLVNAAIDDVRRRVQQENFGHCGRTGDPLDDVRKPRLTARHEFDTAALVCVDAALAAEAPTRRSAACAPAVSGATWNEDGRGSLRHRA